MAEIVLNDGEHYLIWFGPAKPALAVYRASDPTTEGGPSFRIVGSEGLGFYSMILPAAQVVRWELTKKEAN